MRRALLVPVILSLAACASMPADHGSRSLLVYIAAAKAPCAQGAVHTECFQYREQATDPWKVNDVPIEGFQWKQGNEYLLKITEVHPKTVPKDAPPVVWHVDKVVEQHPVE